MPPYHSVETDLRSFSGAKVVRIVDAADTATDEHAHDWPILSLHVLGTCHKLHDQGETFIAGPAAVLHGVGAPHASRIGSSGLEQIELQFDPAWAGLSKDELRAMRCWTGGAVSAACAALAKVWRDSACADRSVAAATRSFLRFAFAARDPAPPAWLTRVQRRLADDEPVSTRQIASDLKLHPVWLARAYRAAVGEGLQQTIRRRRVERAVSLLAESDTSPAQVAVAAGFCDQSHMIRCFGAVLGRTPREIRRQQRMLREAGRQAS